MSPQAGSRSIWLARDRELGELAAALDAIGEGHGSLFLLVGEPGIGKTRLADELSRIARARGIPVHWGRAWEAGGAPSYWPFIQVLRSMCRGLDAETFRALAGTTGPALRELMPELQHWAPSLPFRPPDGSRERFELLDAVARFVHALAAGAPQVLVLDDLHAADPSSLLLLQFLVRDLRERALLVVGTYRDAEARLTPEVGAGLTRVARDATVLALRRLDRREVAEFVAQATDVATTDVEAIYRRTEGNPLFLHELLRLPAATARQPEGIRDVVRARLALSPPDVRRVLDVAAVLGRDFALDTLAAVIGATEEGGALVDHRASRASLFDVAGQLARAVDAGIVEPLEQRGQFRFTHVLLRESLYADLPAERRTSLHAAAADELYRRIGGAPANELAHHLLRAIPLVTISTAAEAALAAAKQASDLLAYEDACATLERTRELLEASAGTAPQLFDVLLALGLARIRAAEIEAGKHACRRAAELARALDDGEAFARAVLASTYEFAPQIRDDPQIALLEEALVRLPPGDGALRACCMMQLAAERQPEPDPSGSLDLARAAIAMARRIGDPETLRTVLMMSGLAMLPIADPSERLALHEEALRLARAAGDKLAVLRSHLFMQAAHRELGNTGAALSHSHAHDAMMQEFRHPRFGWVQALLRAVHAHWEGRFDDAEQGYLAGDALWRHDEARGASGYGFRVGLCRAAERFDDAPAVETALREAIAMRGGDAETLLGELLIAQLYGRMGDRARAAAQVASICAHPRFDGISDPGWLGLLAEPCHLLGDTTLAERLYPALAPHAARFHFLGPITGYFDPPHARSLGLLLQVLGRLDEAVAHLTDAEASMSRAGMRGQLARTRYELAGVLLERARDGDRDRAAALLDAASALAAQLAQPHLVALVAARAAHAGASIGSTPGDEPGARPPFSPCTLRRDGDVWTVTWREHSLRLRDSRGLQVLAQLLDCPGEELHVLQLVSADPADPAMGDAGPLLDREAIASYRDRLLDLRDEQEAAERFADAGRAQRARDEIEILTAELSRAIGLGGRMRHGSSAAERARTAVQKRLRGAIARIEDGIPELGRHLDQTIRTGMFCGYLPLGRRHRRRG